MVAGLLLSASVCPAQEPGLSLGELRARFDEALARIDQPVSQLNASYLDALNRLLTSETESGKLDSVIEIRKEIEEFGDGSEFAAESFRKTEHAVLKAMRTKYLAERERLGSTATRDRRDLASKYNKALLSLEEAETRSGNLKAALAIRALREALQSDPRFAAGNAPAPDAGELKGQLHFVAKGDVELRHRGSKLVYRNTASDRDQYVSGISTPFSCKVGDVIVFSMKARAVYRSFIMAIESEDGRTAVPVPSGNYRYLGKDLSASALKPTLETLVKIAAVPDEGRPDDDMAEMWNSRRISTEAKTGSGWIKCGPGESWHHYAVVISSDMLKSASAKAAEGDERQ